MSSESIAVEWRNMDGKLCTDYFITPDVRQSKYPGDADPPACVHTWIVPRTGVIGLLQYIPLDHVLISKIENYGD